MDQFIIGASPRMSLYCYSVFRIDPYVSCPFGCKYCFVKTLPQQGGFGARINIAKKFPLFLRTWTRSFSKYPIFRMSFLSDPFPAVEKKLRVSLAILNTCLNLRCPIIVNTKSDIILENPWFETIVNLSKQKLVVLQLSIPLLELESKILEPSAPNPDQRFRIAKEFSLKGVPVVIRVQPLIPLLNTNEEYFEEILDRSKNSGARQIIVEFYRFRSRGELSIIKRCIASRNKPILLSKRFWSCDYGGTYKVPNKKFRYKTLKTLSELVKEYKLEFATCKEDILEFNTAKNCCGMQYLQEGLAKMTVRELLTNNFEGVITWSDIEKIPYISVRKKLQKHYNYLKKILGKSFNVLNKPPASVE